VSAPLAKAAATIGLRVARGMFDVYEARDQITVTRTELAAMVAIGVESGMRKVLGLDDDATTPADSSARGDVARLGRRAKSSLSAAQAAPLVRGRAAAARQAHNLKTAGSSPAPATTSGGRS
jgi:hypothetical protein